MRKLTVFNHVTLDGYFTDSKGDMSWAHKSDPEWDEFVAGNASSPSSGALLFGRVTYEMMASFWPTPEAQESMPTVADGMNQMQKFVLSKSLREATWNNTTIVRSLDEIEKIKRDSGPDIVVLGSGNVVTQLAAKGLVDEYQIIVNPLAIGAGRTLFEGTRVNLKLKSTRAFKIGNVLLTYERA